MKGTVKWFNNDKGYGFITGEDGKDYFAHYTKIQGEGFKTIEQGHTVSFDVDDGPKGLNAVNIVKEE
ncbi:cold-shock protein [bacterium]|nr:cold-shock protein [bacterium]